MNTEKKISLVRQSMERHGIAALIVPSNDSHQSEYVADHWKAREWISGFTGSAGLVVITSTIAGLWTDSRYFLQAADELGDNGFTLFKSGTDGTPDHRDWILSQLKPGESVGIDGAVLSMEQSDSLGKFLTGKGLELVTDFDPIGEAWADRPSLPMQPIFEHPVPLSGKARTEKFAAIREAMARAGAAAHLMVALDDIAWTFNLRGRDVECNPVFYAYALIETSAVTLFVAAEKVSDSLKAALEQDGVRLQGYDAVAEALAKFTGKLLLDETQVPATLARQLPDSCTCLPGSAPATLLKSRKNAVEVQHLRETMARDGVALLRLCRWLAATLESGAQLTEYLVAEQLRALRAATEGYFGESFPVIAGYAGNGAIVHYRPSATESAVLKREGVFLLDSGGQYVGGTTDITRTFALGEVPAGASSAYTRVLKGHIALALAQFPKGTAGYQLDPLARMHLWAAGMNYGHGTGHGVGYFLNVHEGPQGIAHRATPITSVPLELGMLISNEPGYYENGQFGIRIENLVLVVEGMKTTSGQFYAFETMSLFPIEATMIDWTLITQTERDWLRDYHLEVQEHLIPLLQADEISWLQAQCAPYLGES